MRIERIDFHTVYDHHLSIHDALLNWSRVVRVSVASGKPTPMFKHYRASEVWISDEPRIPTDTQAGWKMERAVFMLPLKHRDAIRWHYVFPRRNPSMVARKLAVTTAGLHQLVHDGRSMLRNRTY